MKDTAAIDFTGLNSNFYFYFLQRKDGLSTHEEELKKLQSKIEQMEKANLDPKVWTMRGEVTLSILA